jgi:hypothetical protein
VLIARGSTGFTLVEVMLSVLTTALVSSAVYSLLVTTQRLTRLQSERTSLQSNVRTGSLVVLEELGELSTVEGGPEDQNDIVALGASSITYRAMRGLGFICQALSATTVRLARGSFSGHRDPQPGRDEAYVFVSGNPDAQVKDSWRAARIVSVSTATGCPGGLGAGITLTLSGDAPAEIPEAGTPVRIAELMELRLYQSEGQSWLGARSVSTGEAIQPLVGPLAAHGFQLEYLSAAGTATADRTRIKSIRATLRGTTGGSGTGRNAPVVEELVTQVTLRNSVQQ